MYINKQISLILSSEIAVSKQWTNIAFENQQIDKHVLREILIKRGNEGFFSSRIETE